MTLTPYSPFNKSISALIIEKIEVAQIIAGYKRAYQLDTAYLFKDLKYIYLCECPETNLLFYFPYQLDGDSPFYEQLSQAKWYYAENRWEHTKVIHFIKDKDHVLEVGSGAGSFIKQLLSKRKITYTGLELNKAVVEAAKKESIHLRDEALSEHVIAHQLSYDVVCSFQVYEHISDIDAIFQDSIKVLKPGGLLIVSVPNNDLPCIRYNQHDGKYLNMPPHHTNLFTASSLTKIAKHYHLQLLEIITEPIQDNIVDTYLNYFFFRLFLKNTFLLRAFWKLKFHVPFRSIVKLFRNRIKGHTIIAVYQK